MEDLKKAVYIGTIEPSDQYREDLLKLAGISVLSARMIKLSVPSFLKTMEQILDKEEPNIIVLDETMPANMMMEMFARMAPKMKIKNKTVVVYGLDDSTSLQDLCNFSKEEFEDNLKNTNRYLIMGQLQY